MALGWRGSAEPEVSVTSEVVVDVAPDLDLDIPDPDEEIAQVQVLPELPTPAEKPEIPTFEPVQALESLGYVQSSEATQ